MNVKASLICILLLLSAVDLGISKCAAASYIVEGKIVDERNIAISNAKVAIFLDNNSFSIDTCMSDDEGFYKCTFQYDTSKSYSRLFGDDCSNIHKRMELFVYHDDYELIRIILQDNKKYSRKKITSVEDDKMHLKPIRIIVRSIKLIKMLIENSNVESEPIVDR